MYITRQMEYNIAPSENIVRFSKTLSQEVNPTLKKVTFIKLLRSAFEISLLQAKQYTEIITGERNEYSVTLKTLEYLSSVDNNETFFWADNITSAIVVTIPSTTISSSVYREQNVLPSDILVIS